MKTKETKKILCASGKQVINMTHFLASKKTLSIIAFSLILLVIADFILPGRTFFPDENRFIEEAKVLSEKKEFATFGTYRAWEMPLVAIAYAPFYKVFAGGELFIKSVRAFQALIHILTAIGAASICFSIFKNKITALITLFSYIIYPSFLAYQSLLLSETLFMFFMVWGFAFLYIWSENKPMAFVSSVIFFMFSLYTRAVITVLMPVLIFARSYIISRKPAFWIKYCVLSCFMFVICLSPWWMRNWNIFGTFVPSSTSASWNLYLGNNSFNHNAGVDWVTDADPDKVKDIFSLNDELLISKAFMEEAKSYIYENRIVFLKNTWLKFKRFYNLKSNLKPEGFSFISLYNISLMLSWGIAFPLGLISSWINRKKFLMLLPIYLLIIYYTFMHVVVIASLRYRLPIEPFFLVLGSDCVYRFFSIIKPYLFRKKPE
ncbi:MAG: hypothetical protein LBG29_03680, partial [Synergistaceae bacterium]|nr:hypothetical protein [Synergistaceae bacterium]